MHGWRWLVLRGAKVFLGQWLASIPLYERRGRRPDLGHGFLLLSSALFSLLSLPALARRAGLLALLVGLELRSQHRG